jgi:hypothetical protein
MDSKRDVIGWNIAAGLFTFGMLTLATLTATAVARNFEGLLAVIVWFLVFPLAFGLIYGCTYTTLAAILWLFGKLKL